MFYEMFYQTDCFKEGEIYLWNDREFVIKEGSFILNPKYIAANIAEDKEVAKDIIGGVIW